MNEGEIRQLAQLYALVAEMQAVNIEVEGMKAENMQRAALNMSMAYSDEEFNTCRGHMQTISEKMRTEI